MPQNPLRLLPDLPPGSDASPRACRVAGCSASAQGRLGFCAVCERRYEAVAARRSLLVDALCQRLAAMGDPLFAVFGSRRRDFGAHVLAHLEEMNAIDLHVPAAAVQDFVAELDAAARHPT